jgi:hypothetical protein
VPLRIGIETTASFRVRVEPRGRSRGIANYGLSEFDFRYSNRVALGVDDQARTETALKGISGKRLTYRGPDSREAAL